MIGHIDKNVIHYINLVVCVVTLDVHQHPSFIICKCKIINSTLYYDLISM